ncbi:MAG TPA: bifunctional oligoribonuclease/PAP phosphatase NrnA [Magnetospirillaceae bacterium]|nr:bifunctional oligoribonuclease/PAP phosphatase NrnA [Magnetospirillaceae bacterium]
MNLENLAALVNGGHSFIVTSHEAPDGDGLGAMYALCRALAGMGKGASAVLAEPLPQRYRFLDAAGIFQVAGANPATGLEAESSVLMILDTNDPHYAGRVAEALLGKVRAYVLMDHHEPRGIDASKHLLDPSASSTCEIVYRLIRALGAPLEKDIAQALFTGIVYDTGSFGYPKTTEETFACALELVRAGVKPYVIHNLLYENSSVASLLLRKLVLSTLELLADNRIAVQIMKIAHMDESGALYEESEDLINIPLRSESVQVSVFFKENRTGVLRCSLRSKGNVNVAHIAQNFGGGGHRTAAGFMCTLPLEQARVSVIDRLKVALQAGATLDG